MEFEEYRKRGKEMVDYIADYLENIRERRVFPDVKPGYMHNLLPDSAPIEGEKWENIFNDIERVIMPGVTHWQSPHMHAYFPALNSFPSMLGDMLADAINCIGFTWASSPACTELETIVMNWLGKMIGLPNEFLHLTNDSKGGGVIQTTASEATLVCLLAGRTQAIKKFHEQTSGYQDAEINARLVAYCSDQAHSSVEKAALIGLVRMRYIESDENFVMRGKPLQDAIDDDIKQGLIPFWVCNTLGTTGACAFDNLDEVGNVCRQYNLWLHVDAAYAGSAFICPEYRIWLKGIDKVNSIAFNPSKWLMVTFDCTAMWIKDSTAVHRTFNVEPLYLQHENSGLAIDYMHWQIPLSKRFRALKLWFVLRSFGITGLQKHIREGVRLAQKFEALVLADHRFEIPAQRHLGLVVFRIKGENELTERLLKRLNHRGNLHCVPASLKGKYIIRFTVTSTRTTTDDILNDWAEIKKVTTDLLNELNIQITDRAKISLKDTKEKNEAFGSSLLLSNSPMSPKVVNGSFAAIFDADEFLAKTYAGIRIAHQDSPSMRRRVRGIMMSGKQFSLDSRMDLVVQSCYESSATDESTTSTEKSRVKAKPIREDSEDLWEAYESPGTPPNTPPPVISPLMPLTNSLETQSYRPQHQNNSMLLLDQPQQQQQSTKQMRTEESLNSPRTASQAQTIPSFRLESADCPSGTVRAPTKSKTTTANTLTIPKFYDKYKFNQHNASQTVNTRNYKLPTTKTTSSTTTTNNNKPNSLFSNSGLTSKNFISSPAATSTPRIFIKRKSRSVSNNSTISTRSWLGKDKISITATPATSAESVPTVYHGKRFLDPITVDGICAFYNHGFLAAASAVAPIRQHSSRFAFHANVFATGRQMSEIFEDNAEAEDSHNSNNVDWECVRNNFNKSSSCDDISNSTTTTTTTSSTNNADETGGACSNFLFDNYSQHTNLSHLQHQPTIKYRACVHDNGQATMKSVEENSFSLNQRQKSLHWTSLECPIETDTDTETETEIEMYFRNQNTDADGSVDFFTNLTYPKSSLGLEEDSIEFCLKCGHHTTSSSGGSSS